jgi:parallel beta-helix repeat protein
LGLVTVDVKSIDAYTVHNVNTGLNYTSIQGAINAPETLNGHTIFVEKGEYYENVVVDKSLAVVGENQSTTIVDGNFAGHVFIIESDNVTISGFTMQNSARARAYSGIYAVGVNRMNLSSNTIRYDRNAIWLDHSNNDIIMYNTVYNISYGISLFYSNGNNVSENFVYFSESWGIDCAGSDNNTFLNNTLSGNLWGIVLPNSNSNTISGNNASQNLGIGIQLSGAGGNLISNNSVSNSTGNSQGYGIYLVSSDNNSLYNNIAANNSIGIFLEESRSNTLSGNSATNNSRNFGFDHFVNEIDKTNMADGNPVFYEVGMYDAVFNAKTNAATVYLIDCNNITVRDLSLTRNVYGICLWNTSDSRLENVTVSENTYGMSLQYSDNNALTNNNATGNGWGVDFENSNNNVVVDYYALANGNGVVFHNSSNNLVTRGFFLASNYDDIGLRDTSSNNVFAGNTLNSFTSISFDPTSGNTFFDNNIYGGLSFYYGPAPTNQWDNGIDGNFWSSIMELSNVTDLNSDGICDTPIAFDIHNPNQIDHCPLMGTFSAFRTSVGDSVSVISNSTILSFEFFAINATIKMRLCNTTTTQNLGFCRVCIPHILMDTSNISVIIDGGQIPVLLLNNMTYENGTHKWIYFAYSHSTHEIVIVPEFLSFLILPLFTIVTLLSVTVYRKKRRI